MKIEKIAYEQLYPTGVYANQRYRVEVTLEELEDVGEAFKAAKDLVEKTFMALNPQINWNEKEVPVLVGYTPPPIINKEKERIEIAIDNAKTLEELNLYMSDSMKYGLVEHFINKKKSFQ